MAGLVPATHSLFLGREEMGGARTLSLRAKGGHGESESEF
jgi:hypothetical protein